MDIKTTTFITGELYRCKYLLISWKSSNPLKPIGPFLLNWKISYQKVGKNKKKIKNDNKIQKKNKKRNVLLTNIL